MVAMHDLLTLDLFLQAPHLLGQGAQEEYQPRLPVRCLGADRALCLPQRQVVGLLALLDYALTCELYGT